ncbi:MAG: formate C-acetyltransferase/glycerol dehydratase family glycyl radical enzyme, partial [Symbiobacteriaceae bacterium]|nr:formate C-acetyltransferase/glycerol dehydratase family glycyl radical enzyme [Symbiobacteriaceae bacterium]
MNSRVERLRSRSLNTPPALTAERAVLTTNFYRENDGKYSLPVMRARNFLHLCTHKSIYLGEDELIVGERGPAPMVVPTFPELTCHSLEDLDILNSREMANYAVTPDDRRIYGEEIIPYWRGRSMRDKAFAEIDQEWKDMY